MDIEYRVAAQCIHGANNLKDFLLVFSPFILFVISFSAILFCLVGAKLKSFAKPEYPLVSPFVRFMSEIAEILGIAELIFLGIFTLIPFLLTELAFLFSYSTQELGKFEVLLKGAVALWSASKSIYSPLIYGGLAGLILSLVLNLRIIPKWERGEGLHDVNTLVKQFKQLNGFDPLPYVDVKHGCFIGMDSSGKPIYVPWQKIHETHIQVIGTTGSGKGVIMSLIAYQAVLVGECVIWIDPKNDRFSPRILRMAAKKAGKELHFINLNQGQPPQFNLLTGAESHEIEELLVAGFDLKGKGTDGDYHRGKDEDAAIEAARLAIAKDIQSVPELIQGCAGVESITSQENFWRKLVKLGDLSAINTKKGVDLSGAIAKGSILYIVGSTDNERVKMLQKMVLVRINQIIKKQDRFSERQPKCLVLDEFKHVLSPVALTGLGVIRDFDAHCLLAHQSLGDLDSCAGISRAEAEGAVLDNTAIKIIYRLGDSSYAEKLSKNSGKRAIFTEQSSKKIDKQNPIEGAWRETHVPLIDPDVLTHLPMPSDRKDQASVGVLFGVGIAKLFHVGHISVVGDMPVAVAAPKTEAVMAVGDLI